MTPFSHCPHTLLADRLLDFFATSMYCLESYKSMADSKTTYESKTRGASLICDSPDTVMQLVCVSVHEFRFWCQGLGAIFSWLKMVTHRSHQARRSIPSIVPVSSTAHRMLRCMMFCQIKVFGVGRQTDPEFNSLPQTSAPWSRRSLDMLRGRPAGVLVLYEAPLSWHVWDQCAACDSTEKGHHRAISQCIKHTTPRTNS